jgi:hypothetical protein
MDLLIPVDPAEISDIDSPETMSDTPGPSKIKKTKEVQDLDSTSVKTTSISPEQGGDGEDIDGTKFKKNKGEVTLPRDEEDPLKKRNFSPLKPSSWKKLKATMTKLHTILTPDDFDFIVAALNDALLEIVENKRLNRRRCIIKLRLNFKGCNRCYSPAVQFPLCLYH